MEEKEVGLKINEQKTKVLIQSKERRWPEREISIGNVKLEVATNFTYLGTRLTNRDEEPEDTQAANVAYFSMSPLIISLGISWRVRVTLYKTLIRSVLMYDFPMEPQMRSIPLKGKSFEGHLDPPNSMVCGELRTMMRSVKCTRKWPFHHTDV
jgi:hypothetical protein